MAYSVCLVWWGSHGCGLELGHDGHHFCCCDCPDGVHIPINEPDSQGCVGAWPYYGTDDCLRDEREPDRRSR